jgi:hypothetical protein
MANPRFSRATLVQLRDALADHEQRARKWHQELSLQDGRELDDYDAQERVAELGCFLSGFADDLDRWQKTLGAFLDEKP